VNDCPFKDYGMPAQIYQITFVSKTSPGVFGASKFFALQTNFVSFPVGGRR
jgi:hypothetical protein